jgi:hypothetical protein
MEKQRLMENRTKPAKSAGSERNCPGERISGSDRLTVVRRFAREGPQTLEFQSRRGAREKTCQKGVAVEAVSCEPVSRAEIVLPTSSSLDQKSPREMVWNQLLISAIVRTQGTIGTPGGEK